MKTAVAHGFNPLDPFSSGLMGTDPESDTPLGANSLMGTAALIKSLFQATQPDKSIKKPGSGTVKVGQGSAPAKEIPSGANPLNYTQTQVGPVSSREKDLADAAEHRLRRTQAELEQKKLTKAHQDSLRQERLTREKDNPQQRLPKSPTGQINVNGEWLPGDMPQFAAELHNGLGVGRTGGTPSRPSPQQFQDRYQLSQRMRSPGAISVGDAASMNPQDPQFQRVFSAHRGIPTDAPRNPDEIAIYQMLMGQ